MIRWFPGCSYMSSGAATFEKFTQNKHPIWRSASPFGKDWKNQRRCEHGAMWQVPIGKQKLRISSGLHRVSHSGDICFDVIAVHCAWGVFLASGAEYAQQVCSRNTVSTYNWFIPKTTNKIKQIAQLPLLRQLWNLNLWCSQSKALEPNDRTSCKHKPRQLQSRDFRRNICTCMCAHTQTLHTNTYCTRTRTIVVHTIIIWK